MKNLILCGAVLALAACSAPAPLGPRVDTTPGPALSSSEIRELVVGKTGFGTITGSTIEYAMYIAPDGTALSRLPAGPVRRQDKGQWRLTNDNQLCLRWQTYRAGEEYCHRVHRQGQALRLQGESSAEILTFQNGNLI